MMNKKIFYFIILSFISLISFAQSIPKNEAEAGKCYVPCFYYEKEIEWEEVDCNIINTTNFVISGDLKTTDNESKTKFRAYQHKLKTLGYNIEITGYLDKKTIVAHHNYLKAKQKALKKENRRARKLAKKSKV